MSILGKAEESLDQAPVQRDEQLNRESVEPQGVETREKIVDAAIDVFSARGLAGARTEEIAAAAGVNKALLYYYFKGKDALYEAALEAVARRIAASGRAVMDADCLPGEKLLRMTLNHFDRLFSQRAFQSLLQHEMIRAHRGERNLVQMLAKQVFAPMIARLKTVFEEGVRSGELIGVEWTQMLYAALGANVFYFLSAPMMGSVLGVELFAPEVLCMRRRAAVEYLAQAIFVDREHGARLAARVIESVPMPNVERAGKKI